MLLCPSRPGSPPPGRARGFCGKTLALWGAVQGEGVGRGAGCTSRQVQVQGCSGVMTALTACPPPPPPPLFPSGADLETSGSWAPEAHSPQQRVGAPCGPTRGTEQHGGPGWGGAGGAPRDARGRGGRRPAGERGPSAGPGLWAAAAGLNLGRAVRVRPGARDAPAQAPGHLGPCFAASASPEVGGAPQSCLPAPTGKRQKW